MDRVWMKEQEVLCVIGCNEDERVRPQPLIVSVGVWTDLRASLEACGVPDFNRLEAQIERADRQDWAEMAAQELTATTNFATLAKISRKVCTEGKWFTIEALAEAIAREVVEKCGVAKVSVLIDKPDALRKQGVRAAAVQIIRSRKDFQ
ncbi:hypothetical protein T484DRAFT_1973280 [Baffinella frigidus]|nr:hypothetical protein T484DRAFT_1973280 [Cryptophyta sp. CCMP2293]